MMGCSLLPIILMFGSIGPVLCQITPPPRINDSPVIADGRIYFLDHIPEKCQPPIIDIFNGGGVIKDNRALVKKNNPHIIRGNIEIAPTGCLYIEPGTIMKFAPGMGMIVNGTLIARGSELPGGRIVMTKLDGEDIKKPSGNWADDARLVMGNTTRDGRLDLKYNGRWRAICTNYNNFTQIDANVTCRHLGFLKGNFTYHSFARNLTDYILWEKPDCKGGENSLFDCPGASTMQTGRHICDNQEVIGFECEGLRPGLALDHWRGIDFYNSTTEARYQIQGNKRVYMKESLSFLEYLDISYTGLDTYHGRTPEPNIFYQKAAISASPHVPLMNNVTIRYGAYDGLNLTEVVGPIHIANSTISHNRGYGMFIQSSVGRTLINMTEVSHNYGDGIKFYLSNLTIHDFRIKFPPATSMCAQGNTMEVTYPFYQHMDLVQVNGQDRSMVSVGGYCERIYTTGPNMRIGIHFMIMERDPEVTGRFLFRDGGELGRLLDPVPIENGSFPQSITTRSNILHVRFEYKQPPPGLVCKTFPPCIRFLLEFTSDYDVEEEFRLLMSSVHNNIGYGVNIQDMRSKVRISNETIIADNRFGAGIHVYKGAGDIVINGTRIMRNADAGVNITYSGGYQLLNNTEFISNKGYGIITEYLKLNRTRIEARNRLEMVRSKIIWNELIGFRMGNYCLGGSILINESYFAYNYDDAFEYLSCNITAPVSTKLRVEFNTFTSNFRHAIFMRPLLNTESIITNNTFANHSLVTMRIDNGYDLLISRWYRDFPVKMEIFENTFTENTGRYVVNFRLTQYSAVQNLYCKFNYFLRNYINDSFMFVNPRSRANAVIVLSSSNVQFRRNHINNPDSVREVSTHLVDPSIIIDAKENYWATEVNRESDYKKVYNAIFDQDDRYNLAKVAFHPALKTLRLYENILADDVGEYVWEFNRGDVIGGVLEQRYFVVGPGKTLYVDKDIYIFKDKTLLMEPGSKLKFGPSIGMVVHGLLRADGIKPETAVSFDLDDREEFLPIENRTATVRLVDGRDEFEGRLEVEINGIWGTVCNDGWIEENALLACQQLGLTYNREYPTAREQRRAPSDTPILMSWVSCDDYDEDMTKCRNVNADAATCNHNKDVYLRCHKPTWAGITMAAAYRHDQNQPVQVESQIRHIKINNAGLLDPDIGALTPALRIDYNYYQISNLAVHNSMSDGIHVSYNHPYTQNKMEYLYLFNNAGNGLVTKSPRLEVMHSKIDNSMKAGFLYDPFFTEYDALLVRNMIYPERRINMFGQLERVLQNDQIMFLICPAGRTVENREYTVEVRASTSSYKLVVQILDYLPVESAEKVTIFDSSRAGMSSSGTKKWEIEKDLVDFPILSTSSVITIHLRVTGQMSGRLALAVICRPFNSAPPKLHTAVTNTTFNMNNQGIVTKHYNSPSNKRLELFHRHRAEEILFKDLKVFSSLRHAMHMPSVTKFHDDYIPTYEDMTRPERVAKINYTIFHCQFTGNTIGILAEHNHVDFANNVWQWMIYDTTVQGSQKGGLEIEVPRVNDETEREIHKVYVIDSKFRDNRNFAFMIAGYYAEVKVDRNEFVTNRCLLGLISITGMEKNLTMNSNKIQDNVGRYMVDMDILSHSEYYSKVDGQMNLNEITLNRYEGLELPGSAHSPKTYAVAVKGLQNMQANRNIFNNPSLGYELVAGISALTLGNRMNVTLNYWGVTDEPSVRRRIFDFDDWNNYAIADYFPYLTVPNRDSTPSTGVREELFLDPSHLGGRVEKSQILVEIGKPYIVQSDLTILPGITLTIPPGTELQFRPNVGILVLGRLRANGLPFSRIKLRPLQPSKDPFLSGKKKREALAPERVKRNSASANIRLRGDGTLFKDAGFLELYNQSSKSWNMMCDSQFNEENAEVVCRELGKETINVKVRFTHLFDHYIYGKPMYFRKEFWFNAYHCRGDESSLEQCITRYNYNLLPCIYAANYTFITCGKRNLPPNQEYWGNIRFASDTFEEKPLEADIGVDQSSMSYVDIEGAGMLHGEKVGAIQTTYVTPTFSNINITNCAENGYDIIAPRQNLDIKLQNISGNLGYGVNVLVLNGESSVRRSSFLPHGPSTIPYHVYGLVDICRLEKEIILETRMILFYKYGPQMRDCVKIISSRKTVGLRFLQLNLFHEDFSRNVVEIFEGREISENTRIASIVANSSITDAQEIYQTRGNTMAVHIHASISHRSYGFIAEVVKLPLSGLTYPNSEFTHTIENAEIRKNEDGAIQYKNVGEINPSLYIEHCWLGENGYAVLNLTSPPTIDISLQSTISFRFSYNQVSYNKGGMYLFAHTSAISTALRGNMTNNVFAFGTNGEALNISGHYFQRLMLYQNTIYNYTAGDYRDIIHVKDVVVNLTHNYIVRNTGHYILHTYNSDDSAEPQTYARNGIYDNNATALRESTIKVGRGRPKFTRNFLVNNLNDFEMETYPRILENAPAIDAKTNWWGSERRAFINGKTYDVSDNPLLMEVDFWPPVLDNRSMVEGDCFPGWVLDKNRCYRFMGGALPYEKAKEFCQSHGAFLAEARNREGFFNYLIRLMVIEQDWAQRVWVMSDLGSGRCAAFEKNYIVFEEDCGRRYYPFICETDPDLAVPEELTSAVKAMITGICVGVGGIIIIIVIVVVVLWCIKSKRREKERFERTASIRSSLNNLTKINPSLRGTKSTLTILSEGASRRRLNEFDERSVNSSVAKYSESTAASNGVESVHSVSSGYEVNHRPEPAKPQQDNTRPVHSLRPDRSAAGRRNQSQARDEDRQKEKRERERVEREREREERERERERKRRDEERRHPRRSEDEESEERGKYEESSEEDSAEKDDFDSTFDDDEDEEEDIKEADRGEDASDVDTGNMHYRINKSNEHLFQKPATPGKPLFDPMNHADSRDSDQSDFQDNPNKSKSMSSFTDPMDMPRKNIFPPRTTPRDTAPKPTPRPKPIPPTRPGIDDLRSPLVANQDRWSPASSEDAQDLHRPEPAPRQQSQLYSNYVEPPSSYMGRHPEPTGFYNNMRLPDHGSNSGPLYDPVYEGRGSQGSSQGLPHHDPVYEGNPSDQSRSTDRYEPIEYSPGAKSPYGVEQAPDTDYMPRSIGNPALGWSRERLGPPPPAPANKHLRGRLESDIDSYAASAPSIHSDVDYMPRPYKPSGNNRFDEPLPPKPGMDVAPDSRSYSNVHRHGSRDNLNSMPHPPPYSEEPSYLGSRSRSRDRLDQADSRPFRGSREHLDEPPPYSPGEELMPRRHGGRNDVLYLNQGGRPKTHDAMETEI